MRQQIAGVTISHVFPDTMQVLSQTRQRAALEDSQYMDRLTLRSAGVQISLAQIDILVCAYGCAKWHLSQKDHTSNTRDLTIC